MKLKLVWAVVLLSIYHQALALQDAEKWVALVGLEYRITPNIVYKKANGYDCKLDVVSATDTSKPRPTLIYFHGGGWTGWSKEHFVLWWLPYLTKGMNVVNVEYRIAPISLAPAAVEDCRCALRWVYAHVKDYGFDLNRLVLNGHSASGHLSLTTGMLDSNAGFDNECPGKENLKVAAIVNVSGITDVADLLQGPNRKDYAVTWFGSLPNRLELARQLSPLTYVRPGLPAIITIHADADPAVPYQQAVRLRDALNAAGVPNQLVTVAGAKHAQFSADDTVKIQETIFTFLRQHGVLP
jgi:acetyl esterase/lipase